MMDLLELILVKSQWPGVMIPIAFFLTLAIVIINMTCSRQSRLALRLKHDEYMADRQVMQLKAITRRENGDDT